jgi:hypothetical protein
MPAERNRRRTDGGRSRGGAGGGRVRERVRAHARAARGRAPSKTLATHRSRSALPLPAGPTMSPSRNFFGIPAGRPRLAAAAAAVAGSTPVSRAT